MTVYEQQARALKEIAVELKGIRRALDIIGKSLNPDGYRADILIADELTGQKAKDICSTSGLSCVYCTEGPCEHRKEGGEDNG